MKIIDLSDKQEREIIKELEDLSQSEASKVVGGVINNLAVAIAARGKRNKSSDGCGGAPYYSYSTSK